MSDPLAAAPYLALKHAQAQFGLAPDALLPAQRARVARSVARQREIEARVLATPQARQVTIGTASVDASEAAIRARFADAAGFARALAALGLDRVGLRAEIVRELHVEAVLESVSARVPAVSATEVEIFYRLHATRFRTAERRRLRHLLITLNEDIAANRRPVARARCETLLAACRADPDAFADLAARHSECPSAMLGGLLGPVSAGQLFPTLDAALFGMAAGELSGVLESPMGFHILLCEEIHPAGPVPLATVSERIRAQILATRQAACQRAWLRDLMALA